MSKSPTSSNYALIYFVVAIIYVCFAIGLLIRTPIQMFSTKRYPNTREMKVFRAYYGSISAQCFLSLLLYWTLFAEQIDSDNIDPDVDITSKFADYDNSNPDPKPLPVE